MQKQQFSNDLLHFIAQSPTPFHAVQTMSELLLRQGFEQLEENQAWTMQPGGKYFTTRNGSSILAFIYGKGALVEQGIRMVGAHTDSPCLKVKPNADVFQQGYWQVGVEVYGGALLNPWFDRELGLAGKVAVVNQQGHSVYCLIDTQQAVGMVPSLAIHLDREANSNKSVNAQKELPVVLAMAKEQNFKAYLLQQVNKQHPQLAAEQVLDYELSFYDKQAGAVYGIEQDFIASARLDNLLSCYVGLRALLATEGEQSALLVCNDHEEVGSASACGAQGPMLEQFLQRLLPQPEDYARMIANSWFISADNAHAIHPNYADKHDGQHGPVLNQGPVIKVNANQRYASNSETQAMFRKLCQQHAIPVQNFVVRTDMGCGSTIGPITASTLGVKTLDVGAPTWAMHSIRETAGTSDAWYLFRALAAFNVQAVV